MVAINNTGNYDNFLNEMPNYSNNGIIDSGGIGRLKIFAYTGNAALPVNGAVIRIYMQDNNGNREPIYNLISGLDGETEELVFETPAIENSLTPNTQAFSIFYVDVEHPDYIPVLGSTVQIFPNTLTVLPLNLQPKSMGVL